MTCAYNCHLGKMTYNCCIWKDDLQLSPRERRLANKYCRLRRGNLQKVMIKINESPRDAMQALKKIIPTKDKIEYINLLLKVGFDIVDVGSFVSPKAVPQMKDTARVLDNLQLDETRSKISVLVGNAYFAKQLAEFEQVDFINYPFSISEIFQKKNLKANFNRSLQQIDKIIDLCVQKNKKPIISISEAFGNPYGEDWGVDILTEWLEVLYDKGLRYFPLADTTASGSAHLIGLVFANVTEEFPDVEFNFHLHSKPEETIPKIEAAYNAGCRNFDTVFNGMGGCPMTGKSPVANTDTFIFYNWLKENEIENRLNENLFNEVIEKAGEIFD